MTKKLSVTKGGVICTWRRMGVALQEGIAFDVQDSTDGIRIGQLELEKPKCAAF